MVKIFCLGIDVGGTKTKIGIFNYTKLIKEVTFPTEASRGCRSLVEKITSEYENLLIATKTHKNQVKFAGVACPGSLDLSTGRTGHIATMGFNDEPIKDLLISNLKLPVFLQNDANCGALTENLLGVGIGFDSLVYITVSTGIGCGIVINGKILDGNSYLAGEIGHLVLEKDGLGCPCGKNGCLEMYASGTAISRIASEGLKGKKSTKKVFEDAKNGDSSSVAIITSAAKKLVFAISIICQVIDPGVIVLGGGVLKDSEIYMPLFSKYFNEYMASEPGRKTVVKLSNFNGDQVIMGSILFGLSQFEK